MKKLIVVVLFLSIPFGMMAQIRSVDRGKVNKADIKSNNSNQRDSFNRNGTGNGSNKPTVKDDRPKPPITDYKIISVANDTTYIDTTLSIYKDYKFNYLRKDDFGLLPFSNIGETFNSLTYTYNEVSLMPDIGARAKQFAFYDVNDIYYYHVPTPVTDLFFKTTFEQGQNVDAFFTTNINPRLNFSIAYKGLHSLGKYQHILASQGSFRFAVSYQTKNSRYHVKTHFISQDLSTEQNGGLTPQANEQYQSKSGEFDDRSVLSVNFTDADNILYAKRFYLNHYYNIIKGNDSTQNNQVRLGHIMNFTDKEYHYNQANAFSGFGEAFETTKLHDETEFQEVSNTLSAVYRNEILGALGVKAKQTNYNYGYHAKLYFDDGEVIPNRLKGDIFAVGASYAKKIKGFDIEGDAMINVAGDFTGNYIKGKAGYAFNEDNKVNLAFNVDSHAPNYNFLLYQSDYVNYNWRNNFENIQTQNFNVSVTSKKIANLSVDFTKINNYTYFGLRENDQVNSEQIQTEADTLVTPYQYGGSVSYVKLKLARKFTVGKFSLDNTIAYQNVLGGENIFKVPDVVTRNALYYQDFWFKKALFLQTGILFKYFTSYEANAYDPVLSEFYVQNNYKLKGFPTLDYFFNAKVRQARIFFKLENLTTIFEGNNNYAAQSYPYRDFVIRFGLVWNFFL